MNRTVPAAPASHASRSRTWLVAGATVMAVMTSALALTSLVVPGRWFAWALVGCSALAVVTASMRMRAGSSWGPGVVATSLATYALVAVYGGRDGAIQLLPDAQSLDRLGEVLRAGQEAINSSQAPVDAVPGIELLTLGGILAAFLLVDVLAGALRAPAWSGLVLLSLWVPAILLEIPAPAHAFPLAGGAFLVLLLVASAPRLDRPDERRVHVARSAGALAMTLVGALMLAPLVAATPLWDSRPMPYVGPAGSGALQLDTSLDMRSDLGRRSDRVVLRYTAEPDQVGPLRLRTLDEFDGQTWRSEPSTTESGPISRGQVLWPESVPLDRDPPRRAADPDDTSSDEGDAADVVDPDERAARLDVEVVNLDDPRVPLPLEPRSLSIDGEWTYSATRDEVVGAQNLRPGDAYTVDVARLFLTADKLRATDSREGPRGPTPRDFLTVPATSGTEDIVALAQEVTAESATDYDRAIALQSFFRSSRFTYSSEVPLPRTDDAVLDFLTDRTGYCVQFATAMTVMARAVELPTRIAVGFLPGERTEPGSNVYEVTGRQAHAWPEIWFAGYGWVRFEPTPPVQTGALPTYADPFFPSDGVPPLPQNVPSMAVTDPGDSGPSQSAAVTDTTREQPDRQVPWWAITVLCLLAVGGVVLVLARRRTHHHVPKRVTPERAWALLAEDVSAAGLPWSWTWTPAQARSRMAEALLHRGCSEEDLAPLDVLARAVQDERYAPAGTAVDARELHDAVTAIRTLLARTEQPEAQPTGTSGGTNAHR